MPQDSLGYEDIAGLIHNAHDPEEIVRLASMRAVVRLARMEEVVPPSLADKILDEVKQELPRDREKEILGVSFLPPREVQLEIDRILASSDQQDQELALRVLSTTREQIDSIIERHKGSEQQQRATRLISQVLRDPDSLHRSMNLPEVELGSVSPELATHVVTALFAELTLLDQHDREGECLSASENIGHLVHSLGPRFEPDVPALFGVYQSFFRHSTQFWLRWLEKMKGEGLNLYREMPNWFPTREGALGVTRQLEWTVSRAGVRPILGGLDKFLRSPDPRNRWAAAQLIEFATRYSRDPSYPRFGGGSGPRDLRLTIDTRNVQYETPPPPEPPRYTDVTIYEGHLFAGQELAGEKKADDDLPLIAGNRYTLEVAIRLQRTGIDSDKQARGVKNPRQDREPLTVYVLAEPQGAGIEIEESFTKITWPYDADSESAFFRFEVKAMAYGDISRGIIEVRLYDGSLDLLDIVRLSVVSTSKWFEVDASLVPRRSLTWPSEPEILHIDPKTPLRLLSIDVGFDGPSSKFKLLFKFLSRNGKSVAIPGSSNITRNDLETLLVKVRNFWTDLVITNYATKLTVTKTTFGKYLEGLRTLGWEAWDLLFGTRYAAKKGASETIRDLLRNLQPNEGAHIQITYSHVDDFIFPWAILYPRSDPPGPIDPFQFWGARYQIEQVDEGPQSDELTDEPVDLTFVLDPAFGDSGLQEQLFQGYETAAVKKLKVTDPIRDADLFFAELARLPAAHLYYFYCHGYAPTGNSMLNREAVALLKKSIEAIPPESPEAAALETLLQLTGKMNNEPWIYIGNAEIRESQIKPQQFFKTKRPIVFLNMCQSAGLLPSFTSGLVRVFLEHNASAVIGTESPMTSVFANAFSQVFFDELFAGCDVGTALWKARRHFLQDEMRNPLGLAYTLYGRATARLGNRPLIERATHNND
jgi:hypothetical protein